MAQRDNPFEGSRKHAQRKARHVKALADIRRHLARVDKTLTEHTGALAVLARADEALAGSIHDLVSRASPVTPGAPLPDYQAAQLRKAMELLFEFEMVCDNLDKGRGLDMPRVRDLAEGSRHLRRSTP